MKTSEGQTSAYVFTWSVDRVWHMCAVGSKRIGTVRDELQPFGKYAWKNHLTDEGGYENMLTVAMQKLQDSFLTLMKEIHEPN